MERAPPMIEGGGCKSLVVPNFLLRRHGSAMHNKLALICLINVICTSWFQSCRYTGRFGFNNFFSFCIYVFISINRRVKNVIIPGKYRFNNFLFILMFLFTLIGSFHQKYFEQFLKTRLAMDLVNFAGMTAILLSNF